MTAKSQSIKTQQQPYSYLIAKEDGMINAYNKYGDIQFSENDATTVIQNAINSGGNIVLKNFFTINSPITISKGIIQGIGQNNSGLIANFTDDAMIKLNYDSYDNYATFRDLSLDGANKQNVKGIKPISGYNARINFENLWIHNCNIGIQTADPNDSANYGTVNHKRFFTSIFTNCRFTGNNTGIYVNELSYVFNQCNISGNTNYGILINDQAQILCNNTIWSHNGNDIYLEKSGPKTISIYLTECWCENTTNEFIKGTGMYTRVRDIVLTGGSFHNLSNTGLLDFTEIDGNIIIDGIYLRPSNALMGNALKYTYNRTFVRSGRYYDGTNEKWLSNRGTSTISDGGTIAHNLISKPCKIRLTGSVAGEIVTVTNLDVTNITIAIKKHDGTAGTAQTIYWETDV